MRRVVLVLVVSLVSVGCETAWRPALVVTVSAIDAVRASPTDARVAERWDLRASATLVLAPRAVRRLPRPEPIPRVAWRTAAPCIATWLCTWERAARADALAHAQAATLETSP